MSDPSIHLSDSPRPDELAALYESVGWKAYTRDPDDLVQAVRNSTFVVTARQDERLIGLARCLSDDVSIVYLQDILVTEACQCRGIGHRLLEACLERYAHVRNFVLLSDDRPEQHAFYAAHGLTNVAATRNPKLNAFVRILNISFEAENAAT